MVLRSIIRIDEEKCTGCGLCVPACAEGALKIVDGKARLVSDIYCDGLGACIAECPQGALTVEEREAEEFNEEAVKYNLKIEKSAPLVHHSHSLHQSCPSAHIVRFERNLAEKERMNGSENNASMLSQWPVQLTLLPPNAPFFEDADLLIAADCVPFACSSFHNDFLRGRIVAIGCPKLDNAESYKKKLTEIFRRNNIRSITVVNMEVPCCFGLHNLVKKALDSSGKSIPLTQEIITIKGDKTLPSRNMISDHRNEES